MDKRMQIYFFEATYQGARQSNQDYYLHAITQDWCCFVLADGLGGHFRGEIASKSYCEALIKEAPAYAHLIYKNQGEGIDELMFAAWKRMCHEIKAQFGNVDSHTTITMAWLDNKQFISAHVGDSRIYRLSNNKILFRTPDHTPVQELFERDLITEEDFAGHPLQNRLLRTVNLDEPPLADVFIQEPLTKGETLLLCSDGFWNCLSPSQILTLGKTDDIPSTTTALIENILTMNPKSADNITVQLIRLT